MTLHVRRRNPADGKDGLPCNACGRKWTVHAVIGSALVLLCDKHAAALSMGVEEAVAEKADEVTLHPGHPSCPVCGKRLEPKERVLMASPGGPAWHCNHQTIVSLPVSFEPRGDAATLEVERFEGRIERQQIDDEQDFFFAEDDYGDR